MLQGPAHTHTTHTHTILSKLKTHHFKPTVQLQKKKIIIARTFHSACFPPGLSYVLFLIPRVSTRHPKDG